MMGIFDNSVWRRQILCLGTAVYTLIIMISLVKSVAGAPPIPILEGVRTLESPIIDGLLEDTCWQKALPVKKFWLLDGSVQRDDLAWAKVAYDNTNLYIAYHMLADNASGVPCGSTNRDEGVWFSPNVQIFFQPTTTSGYYVFTLNSLNTQEEGKNGDSTWNCRWQSATFVAPDKSYWQAEIAIPYAVFDLSDNPGEEWRLSLTCVVSLGGKGYILTWAPTFENFHSPAFFGRLFLKSDQWDIWQSKLTAAAMPGNVGTLSVVVEYFVGKKPRDGVVTVNMKTPGGKSVVKKETVSLTENAQMQQFLFPAIEFGMYEFTITLSETPTNRVLAERQVFTTTPQPFDAWLDKSLYTDQREAQLTIKTWQPDMAGKACRIVVQDENGKVVSNTVEATFNRESLAVAILDIEKLPAGQYSVIVLPDDKESKDQRPYVCSSMKKLSPMPGTVWYDSRGVLYKDDRPFFPFGMYYIQNFLGDGLLEEFAEAGLNTIVWEWTNAEGYVKAMKEMEPHGVHLITSVQNEGHARNLQEEYFKAAGAEKEALADRYYKHIAAVVGDVAESKPTNLIAWYVQDEPNLEILPFVRRAAEVVAANDPRHPTLVVPCHSVVLKAYAPVVDILWPDSYPGFPDGPMTKVSSYIDEAHQAVLGRKPVMVVLQAFGEPQGPKGITPTPAEIRCMTYLALVHEARGILYFSYPYNGPMREKHPEMWNEIKKLAGEVRYLAPALVQNAGSLSTKQSGDTLQVHTRLIQHGDTTYLLAVNTERRPIANVQWEVYGFRNESLEVLWESRKVQIKGGRFYDDFEPLAVHVYRQTIK